jgi:hypothetical protein
MAMKSSPITIHRHSFQKTSTSQPSTHMKSPYNQLLNLLATYSDAKARLTALESETNRTFLDIIDASKPTYTDLQTTLAGTEVSLRDLAAKHPEWFADSKTLKTPFGQLHSHRSTSHEAPDTTAAIARIKAAQARAIKSGDEVLATRLGALIRTEDTLNFDALGDLDTPQLTRFGITRRTEESLTIKEAKVTLGSAIKAVGKRPIKATSA